MRFLQLFLLVSLILSKVIYSAFWQLNFYLNQKEIAAIECENKDRPEMNCNGKCYLAKQLQKADNELAAKKEKQQHSLSVLKSLESSLFVENWKLKFEVSTFQTQKKSSSFHYTSSYFFLLKCDVFHPPTLIFNV
ncbi:MAG: hypothetical protein FGM14_12100 [Flavobacteriales bacterium]|nr:hypothetical protein [Flavobacteriales bacterium]